MYVLPDYSSSFSMQWIIHFLSSSILGLVSPWSFLTKALRRLLCAYGRCIFSHFQVYIQIMVLQIARDYYHLFMCMIKVTVICIP